MSESGTKNFDNPETDLRKDWMFDRTRTSPMSRCMISYREFKDDFARAAFQQDMSYDLSDSKEIGFRGAIIDVL